MNTPTPTPRTDRLAELSITADGTWIAHARQLERELVKETASNEPQFLAFAGAAKYEEIPASRYDRVVAALMRKKNGGAT